MSATDYFLDMKAEGINGESIDEKHKDCIDVLSYSWGATNTGTAAYDGGTGSGKVNLNDFHFTMKVNKASPKLLLWCAQGKMIKECKFFTRKTVGDDTSEDYQIYTFKEVMVTSFQTGAGGGGDPIPTESISFNFAKVEYEYKVQNNQNKLENGPKAKLNTKLNKHTA